MSKQNQAGPKIVREMPKPPMGLRVPPVPEPAAADRPLAEQLADIQRRLEALEALVTAPEAPEALPVPEEPDAAGGAP